MNKMAFHLAKAVLAAGAVLLAPLAPSRAEVAQVRIGLQRTFFYLPILVAQSEGMFEKNAKAAGLDLKVELSYFSGATAMNEALLSDSIDVGSVGLGGALIAWDKTRGRQHIKILAAVSRGDLVLFTNRPNIKSFADFTANEKIAVPAFNSIQAMILREAAKKAFGDASKLDQLLISLPQPDAVAAILAGTAIGGYFASPPFIQVLEKDQRVHKVLSSDDVLDGEHVTTLVMEAKQGFVDDNPKVSRVIVASLREANKLIAEKPERAAAIYLDSAKMKMTGADIEHILTDHSLVFSDKPEGVRRFAAIMGQQNLLTKQPEKLEDVFFNVGEPALNEK
jgi:NitT/TauT family transport system substrate-binding protein